MRIATWNVNSLRVRLPQVLAWLNIHSPDVLAIQETKLADADFPLETIQEAGYQAAFSGQKTYNGVAILSRTPVADVVKGIPGMEDEQRRVLGGSFGEVRVLDLYVPNGAFVGSTKYEYKLAWLTKLTEHLKEELRRHPKLVVLGDFNIAPEEPDVYNPKAWEGQVLFSEPERAAFRRLLDLGLHDTFRRFEQGSGYYTWWDYRTRAFGRNHGLRIDHILTSPELYDTCTACVIDKAPRGWEQPSDHAPVLAEIAL